MVLPLDQSWTACWQARMISWANMGVRMRAAPPPLPETLLEGQPMLISMPSKPISAATKQAL